MFWLAIYYLSDRVCLGRAKMAPMYLFIRRWNSTIRFDRAQWIAKMQICDKATVRFAVRMKKTITRVAYAATPEEKT